MPGSPRRASDVSSPVNSHSYSNLFLLVFPSASSVLCRIYNVSWKTRPSVCLQRFWMYTIYVSKILPLRAYKLQRILLLRFYLPLVLCFCHRCLISNIKFLNEWHICLSDKQNWLCNVINIQSKTSEATLLSPFVVFSWRFPNSARYGERLFCCGHFWKRFLLWPGFICRAPPPGVDYTSKPHFFHRRCQFVEIVTGSWGKKKEGERKDLYFVNFSKCVPNLRGSKRCGERERKRRGVTVGETLKHRLLGPHVARKADYRGCGLLTMIICLHDKNRWSVGKGWVVGGTRTLKILALEKGGILADLTQYPPEW